MVLKKRMTEQKLYEHNLLAIQNSNRPVKSFTCIVCGSSFQSAGHHAKYCPVCAYRQQVIRCYNQYHQKKNPLKSSKSAKVAHKLRIQRQLHARQLGISYGQYIQQFNINEREL